MEIPKRKLESGENCVIRILKYPNKKTFQYRYWAISEDGVEDIIEFMSQHDFTVQIAFAREGHFKIELVDAESGEFLREFGRNRSQTVKLSVRQRFAKK